MIHNLIYDVGMNNGDDTAYYLQRGFRVLAIEADPDLCGRAALRFKKEIDAGRLTILNVGIASQPGTLDFWICETNSHWNSFHEWNAARGRSPHHSIPVPCQTFEQVLKNYGIPYFLKVDIEANDRLCIEALARGDDLPRYVSVELGDLDWHTNRFQALGFTGFQCISQYNFLPLEQPPARPVQEYERWNALAHRQDIAGRALRKILGPARLQAQLQKSRMRDGWFFSGESSGPFGDELPGRWQTAQEMRDTFDFYKRLFEQRAPSPFWGGQGYSFWVDLHTRR